MRRAWKFWTAPTPPLPDSEFARLCLEFLSDNHDTSRKQVRMMKQTVYDIKRRFDAEDHPVA